MAAAAPLIRRGLFVGMMEDWKSRGHLYFHDYEGVLNLKVAASVLFMFFTSIGPAITFSSLLQKETDESIGAVEVMLSSAISGVIMSLFAGQPLVIVGVTGPVSILTISIYGMSKGIGVDFLQFYAWSQVWCGLFHIILAITNFCDLLLWISSFSCEVFGVLIAVLYIYTGVTDLTLAFGKGFDSGFFQLGISLGMLWMSMQLHNARHWVVFSAKIREIISDYGPSFSLIFWTVVVHLGSARKVDISLLEVPDEFGTTSGRNWWIPLGSLPVWAVFAAIIPGLITTLLFFFDHNVSSIMAQAKEFKLKHGPTFHWDFFVLGCCIILSGLLGIPPTNGLIPQAPLHVKSLLKTKAVRHTTEIIVDEVTGEKTEKVTALAPGATVKFEIQGAYEQRMSNMLQAGFIGMMCFQPFLGLLKFLPTAALSGLFLFMGFASFSGNQFAERVALLLTQKKLRHSSSEFFEKVPYEEMRNFTCIQLAILLCIFGITLTPAAMVFPVLIGILIPLRSIVLPKYFDADYLSILDHLEAAARSKAAAAAEGDVEGDAEDGGASSAGVELLPKKRSASMGSAGSVEQHHHDHSDPIAIENFSIRHIDQFDPLETVEPVDDETAAAAEVVP